MRAAPHAIAGHPCRMNQSGPAVGPAEGADGAVRWMGVDSLDREQPAHSTHKEDASMVISVTSATIRVLARRRLLILES